MGGHDLSRAMGLANQAPDQAGNDAGAATGPADPPTLADYRLEHRYREGGGRVFLTGTQALVRVLLDQARRDRRAGLDTAGFVSGYRGSPLGGLDQALWQVGEMLAQHRIEFLPAVNEDLAATAVLGSQQVETDPHREVQGVFGLWYGKGPGVDRAGDALKHGNAYGSSPTGGVLVVAGDDHGCVSSSMPHQSDVAFMAWFMPTLNPSSVAEYLAFGEYGFALSRFSGMWVGFKAISETVESGASVDVAPDRVFVEARFDGPPDGLHYRWPDLPGPQIEARLEAKKRAVFAFAEANPIDRRIYGLDDARYGIVTTGKAHGDLLEALRLLGLDESECRRLGIDLYKVGMVWPLAPRDALAFVRGKREILVVEEKRGIIESQFKEYFYDWPGDKPQRMVGKQDENGQPLVPWIGELSPIQLAAIVAGRLDPLFPGHDFRARAAALSRPGARAVIPIAGATRTPYFCSGCPHNTSTRVPEGSQALAGIGCHFMASWMDRETTSLIQMGGEGVNWAASSRFTGRRHIFQNLGEGTYYHSGSMAIRQSLAAGANITYKILFNDAVAMTGGQPVDGPISVQAIAHSVRAEGVQRIALVSDDPGKFESADFPPNTTLHHRRELDAVQRGLREISGVTVLIYEQACATEKRRRRKRGQLPMAPETVVINPLVCEGCGDCSVASNCLSVEPLQTPLGRKRRINPSTCNQDLSCLEGFCPSFVTVKGTRRGRKAVVGADPSVLVRDLPVPTLPSLDQPFELLVTGVGGTGVITVGAVVAMAAHLEGKGVSVLDFTGFAQKFGPVISFLRVAGAPDALHQVRIERGRADALIGCDAVVSASPKAAACLREGTRAVVNLAQMPTGDIVRQRDASLAIDLRVQAIADRIGQAKLQTLDANALAERLLGDAVFANVMMLGFAWQDGVVPVSEAALLAAIDLNGTAVAANRQAFAWGRIARAAPALIEAKDSVPGHDGTPDDLDEFIETRARFLQDYQDAAWADRYRAVVNRMRQAESALGRDELTRAVAQAHFRLMGYKDEYEVARLHHDPSFVAGLDAQYEPGYVLTHHLAPRLLSVGTDSRGRPGKRRFGAWIRPVFKVLALGRHWRGTRFDLFGRQAERRRERALIDWHEQLVQRWCTGLDAVNHGQQLEQARAIDQIRGFGPVKEASERQVRAQLARTVS